jgi:hypothetical protein
MPPIPVEQGADTHDLDPERSMDEKRLRPRSAAVIGLAFVCSCIGFVVALVLTKENAEVTFLGESGRFQDEATQVIAVALLAGSVGWYTGAVVGWSRWGPGRVPSRAGAWAMRIAALLPLWLLYRSLQSLNGHPDSIMMGIGAALVIGTLFVLAQRGRFREASAAIGAGMGIVMIVAASISLGSALTI